MIPGAPNPIVWTYAAALAAATLFLGVFWFNAVLLVPDAVAMLMEAVNGK